MVIYIKKKKKKKQKTINKLKTRFPSQIFFLQIITELRIQIPRQFCKLTKKKRKALKCWTINSNPLKIL
jgi:hypothetical protein